MILFLNLLKNALKKSASTQISLNNYDFYTTYVTYLGGGSLKNSSHFQIQFVLLRLQNRIKTNWLLYSKQLLYN